MICTLGLGSNLDEPKSNLEAAARALMKLSEGHFRISPIYKTKALLPAGASPDWDIPFLNAVVEIDWAGSAVHLLSQIKLIEEELGRKPAERWAPRPIDIDILTFGDEEHNFPSLQVPHKGVTERSFVLDPLKDLRPGLQIPGYKKTALQLARKLKTHQPLIMGIANLTPDSFSDGGELQEMSDFQKRLRELDNSETQILDVGAESTRPGAVRVEAAEEWARLEPAILKFNQFYQNRVIKPLISVDTYKAEIAERALELGVNWINDVSGLSDPNMISVLKDSDCDYVLMHNLGVPADPKKVLSPDCDPVMELKNWLDEKMDFLIQNGISQDRIIFDIGIGFGKSAEQSVMLLKRIEEFSNLPVRLLVGHSRKSFMKFWGLEGKELRDQSTVFLSKELASKGVDILRVHDFKKHMRAFT